MDLLSWVPNGWSDLGAIAQVLTFIILLVALIYAKGQLSEAGRARKLQATRVLLDEIANEEVRKARSWVLDELPTPDVLDLNKLSMDDHWKARRVAVALDRVGYMVKQGLVPEDALFEWQQDEIEQLWYKLKPIVKEIQQTRNRPHYCAHFEYLATEWFQRMKAKKK